MLMENPIRIGIGVQRYLKEIISHVFFYTEHFRVVEISMKLPFFITIYNIIQLGILDVNIIVSIGV